MISPSPQGGQRKGAVRLSSILNSQNNIPFRNEAIIFEGDTKREEHLKKMSCSAHGLNSYHLKPISIGLTASPLKKEAILGNIFNFQNNTLSTTETLKGNSSPIERDISVNNLSQNLNHLQETFLSQSSESLNPLQIPEQRSSKFIQSKHAYSKSTLLDTQSGFNFHHKPSFIGNPNFGNVIINQRIQNFGSTHSNLSQSPLHFNSANNISLQPLVRSNSRIVGSCGGLNDWKKTQNQISNTSLESQGRNSSGIFNSQHSNGSNFKINRMNTTTVSSHFKIQSQQQESETNKSLSFIRSESNDEAKNKMQKKSEIEIGSWKCIEVKSNQNIQDQKTDFFATFSSMRNIVIPDETKKISIDTNNNDSQQKKIISLSTSNALLPQSFVNAKNMQKFATRQVQSQKDFSFNQEQNRTQSNQANSSLHQSIEDDIEKSHNNGILTGSKRQILKEKQELGEGSPTESDETAKENNKNSILKQNDELRSKSHKLIKYQDKVIEPSSLINEYIQRIKEKHFSRIKMKEPINEERIDFLEETKGKVNCKSTTHLNPIILQREKKNSEPCNREIPSFSSIKNIVLPKNLQIQDSPSPTISVSEIIEEFNQMITYESNKQTTQIGQALQFYLPNIDHIHFCNSILQIFTNAINLTMEEELFTPLAPIEKQKSAEKQKVHNIFRQRSKKNSKLIPEQEAPKPIEIPIKLFKIPQKLFNLLLSNLKDRVLISKFNLPTKKLEGFETNSNSQLVLLGLQSQNILDELGGEERSLNLINEFLKVLGDQLKVINFESDVKKVCLNILSGEEEEIDSFVNKFKQQKRVCEKELQLIKHVLFEFLTEKEEFIDSDIKFKCLQTFEKLKMAHFSPFSYLESASVASDIMKYIFTKKQIQDYFLEDKREQKIQTFLLQMLDCFFYKVKPSQIASWFEQNTTKIDEHFFKMLEPLLLDPFRRRNFGPAFLKNSQLKFFWIKMKLNLSFDCSQILLRLDELLLSTKSWIDGMVASRQLTKQQLSKLDQIQKTEYLKWFISTLLTEDTFNVSDIPQQLIAYQTSYESVLFQIKGLKRILLLMHFKQNETYEIAEFFLKIFQEAWQIGHSQTH